ncbi:MAG TPA: PKD domain-containing protein, partial [Candidatus Thermoplasmatota archaeon]|nr:PKD domain-containing protein [Candidatus Thermoplasmatota archaeon]
STGIYTWDANEAYTGNKSIGVRNLTSAALTPALFWVTTDYIPVDPDNSTYAYSAWYNFLKLPAATQTSYLFIDVYDKNYSYLGGSGVGEWYEGAGWRFLETIVSLSPHGAYVKLKVGQEVIWPNEPDPSVEIRFDDVNFSVANTIPNTPVITGETHGKARTVYPYTITATDPDQDPMKYFIDWGDNTTQMTSQYASGETVNLTHIWGFQGTYIVKVKAIDEYGMESHWATLTVTLPCTSDVPLHPFRARLFERFPHAFPILRQLLGW